MLRVRIEEQAGGHWLAYLDGEKDSAVLDRSPDQALAGLVRANLRRLGIADISYSSAIADADDGSGEGSPPAWSQGRTILRPDAGGSPIAPDRKQGS